MTTDSSIAETKTYTQFGGMQGVPPGCHVYIILCYRRAPRTPRPTGETGRFALRAHMPPPALLRKADCISAPCVYIDYMYMYDKAIFRVQVSHRHFYRLTVVRSALHYGGYPGLRDHSGVKSIR